MITSPLKAIRAYCIECSGGVMPEVKLCTITRCELYDFRMGKNPHRKKKIYTDEEKQALRDRLTKAA